MSDDENSDADYLEDFNNYYMDDSYDVENHRSHIIDDPEHYEVEVYSADMVNELFDNIALSVSKTLQISPYLAKMLLYKNDWIVEKVISQYENNKSYFVQFYVKTYTTPAIRKEFTSSECKLICPVCMNFMKVEEMCGLNCEHWFCKSCWVLHAKTKISQGCSVEISCMDSKCDVLVLEDFILSLQLNSQTLAQYRKFMFQNFVKVHPLLTFCVGPNCNIIFKVNEVLAKRVTCSNCNVTFCFKCGDKYHAPTECDTIKKWLTKCKDDSETANYFIAHTKDCPRCSICIEKNGGCNHMQCYKCKHDFCWMCLGDWKLHGSEYYECSRYKENPDTANETAKARAALKKYLHYYERWHNHAKSLKLEEQTLEKIKLRIHKKVMNSSGTWIDWQYLLDAAALLAKCRYTLQYTYPFAFYMKQEPRKDLFEYQQAQLEAEIENLSWKIERAETTDRGDLENQMYIAEKRRKMLLRDFLKP